MNAFFPVTSDSASEVTNVSRRAVLLGLSAGAFVLASGLPTQLSAQEKKYGGDAMEGGLKDDPRIFLSILPDDSIVLLCSRAEMGQGVRTSWAMVVADELGANINRITVRQAPGNEALYGNQNTDGSRSMRHHFLPLRRMGAAARQMLAEEAAAQWKVPVTEVSVVDHQIVHRGSSRRLRFGALAAAAATRPLPAAANLKLRPTGEFRYIGREDVSLVDNLGITTGSAVYGIDAKQPNMAYAVVARPSVYGGKVKSYEASQALAVPGVLKIVQIEATPLPSGLKPLGGVAVIAENTFAAIKGRSLLKIEWDDGPNVTYDSTEYRETLKTASRAPGKVVRDNGDVENAFKTANRRVEAEYYMPHLAQAPMEPPSATARVTPNTCEVWCSVQAPEALRSDLAKRFNLPVDKVTVNSLLIGGGFGRKSKPDYGSEAAILSKAMDGRPVKVTFTREDDLVNGFLHTVSAERLEAGLDKSGKTIAWRHRTVAPSITALFMPDAQHEGAFELGMGAVDVPFAIPNIRVENPAAKAHTRVGWFRSVSNIPHAFAVQSFVAELAAAAGRDPKEYLLELLGPDRSIDARELSDSWIHGENPKLYPFETGRLRGVIEKVAAEAGWGRKLSAGSGLGIAAHRSFVSYAAVVVEVAVGKGGVISIPRVDIAFDCGIAINPERVRSQLEGAVIQGVGLATIGEITFKSGRVEQTNFDGYELLRMDASPKVIRTHIVNSGGYDKPLGGVGEPGLPPVAPALTNAIYAATGKRIRTLPIRDQLA